MKDMSDVELTELADWAERHEREATDLDLKKSYGAIRQGSDWLLRYKVRERQREIDRVDKVVENVTVKKTM